jgi:hypothetical protein
MSGTAAAASLSRSAESTIIPYPAKFVKHFFPKKMHKNYPENSGHFVQFFI